MENHAGWYATAAQSQPKSLMASRDTKVETAKKIGSGSHKCFSSLHVRFWSKSILNCDALGPEPKTSQFDQTRQGDASQLKDPFRALQNLAETVSQAVQFLKSPGGRSLICLPLTPTSSLRVAEVRRTLLTTWILRICSTTGDQRCSSPFAQRMKHAANHAENGHVRLDDNKCCDSGMIQSLTVY